MAGFSSAFLCQKLVFFIHAVSTYLRLISAYFLSRRLQGDGGCALNKKSEEIDCPETERLDSSKDDNKGDEFGFSDNGAAAAEEEEKPEPEVYLKFKFPTYDEFRQVDKETGNNVVINSEVVPPATVSRYQFSSVESCVSAFIDESETFAVKEREVDSLSENGEVFGENLVEEFHQTGYVHDERKEVQVSEVEEGEEIEGEGFREGGTELSDELVEESVIVMDSDSKSTSSDQMRPVMGKLVDSDSESTSFDHIRSVMGKLVDSYSDGFLSDGDFGGDFDEDETVDSDTEVSGFEEYDDEDSDIMEELKNLEEDNVEISPNSGLKLKPDSDENGFINKNNDSEKLMSKDPSMSSSEDANKLESLWEHQELIEQLKMELKKVRATGLPTILEESESPKISDDLKPWRIDEFQREDCIGELHKFYKSYRERMRKFDIMNYQKMYAMGFLQLKDPLQSISKQKRPPTLKSLVSQNLWLSKHKIHGSDPMKKFIKELQGDLEAVYVGQMCLSWEFLHWQYEKAWDLWDTDPRGRRRYNEVANEFQQFQVLMHRFVEDELFQGPRVQNYVKTRCAVRNLLQVPVIREDSLKEKREAEKGGKDEYVITSDMLVEIVEESIRTFWRFVRADKDCSSASMNGNKKLPELPSPEDHKLVVEIKKDLQKKERKLKELLRSENCILRKLRRQRDDDHDSDQVLYFFSQVDMKLVGRVLNMSRVTREQLVWCHKKLGTISFVNRKKIQVEPAFLLFPC